jgi:vancomycin resistance protein VanW
MKRVLKQLLPDAWRLRLRILVITSRDITSGIRFKFARHSPEKLAEGKAYPERITIEQPINISKWAEDKKHNLRKAISAFCDLPIGPGRVFSFWHYVKNPTEKAGYKIGFNIIQGRLDFDWGGGLCQLSGLLYHLALTAALEIEERYPHSVDLYTDETRYTPLGADATTAYGYKDLRIKNSLHVPVCFRARIEGDTLIGALCAPESLKTYDLKFDKRMRGELEVVETLRRNDSGDYERIALQTYSVSDHNEII